MTTDVISITNQLRRRTIAHFYDVAARYKEAGDRDSASYLETVAEREELVMMWERK
jgi:hypothetical protein